MICAFFFFFFNDTATTEIYTLSLHDALPIFRYKGIEKHRSQFWLSCERQRRARNRQDGRFGARRRSEEHTSELQSHLNLVCRLLLEKKKSISTIESGH